MDSNSQNSASRDRKEEFKQVAETLPKLFTLLATIGLAIKTSDHAAQEFFTKHYILMNAFTLGIVAYFIVLLLHAMLHQHVSTNSFATLLLLVLGIAVSVIASSLISPTISLITLVLWVIVFISVLMFKCQEHYIPILTPVFERVQKLIETYKPQFTALQKFQKWIESYRQQTTLLPV